MALSLVVMRWRRCRRSKYNVQTPDELVEKYGADTLRCYEMFLGPLLRVSLGYSGN